MEYWKVGQKEEKGEIYHDEPQDTICIDFCVFPILLCIRSRHLLALLGFIGASDCKLGRSSGTMLLLPEPVILADGFRIRTAAPISAIAITKEEYSSIPVSSQVDVDMSFCRFN